MTKNDLTTLNPALAYELVSMSVRMYRAHLELIDRAVAVRQAADPSFDRSDYIRETMALQAAIDLGVEIPLMPPIIRGRGGSIVDRAAAKLGMTKGEFEEAAVRAAAAQALGADAIDDRRPSAPPPARSTMRPAARSGMYSSQPEPRKRAR